MRGHSRDAMTRGRNENYSTRVILGHHHKLVTGNFRLLLRCATIKVSSFYHLGEAPLLSLVTTSDHLCLMRYHCHKVLHNVVAFLPAPPETCI